MLVVEAVGALDLGQPGVVGGCRAPADRCCGAVRGAAGRRAGGPPGHRCPDLGVPPGRDPRRGRAGGGSADRRGVGVGGGRSTAVPSRGGRVRGDAGVRCRRAGRECNRDRPAGRWTWLEHERPGGVPGGPQRRARIGGRPGGTCPRRGRRTWPSRCGRAWPTRSPRCANPVVAGMSWTTDAPYRETRAAIDAATAAGAVCVEMEAGDVDLSVGSPAETGPNAPARQCDADHIDFDSTRGE